MSFPGKHSWITGMGIITPIGVGTEQFGAALKKGASNFSYLEFLHEGKSFTYPCAKPEDFNPKQAMAALPLANCAGTTTTLAIQLSV